MTHAGDNLRCRALMGDDMPVTTTTRNRMLRRVRYLRSLRSWSKEGCYAWWRLTDDLKSVQRAMAQERRT